MKKNAEVFVVAGKGIRQEIIADKTNYMYMSQDQNAGQSCNIKNNNRSFERMEHFKYMGTNLTNQNSSEKKTKSRLNSGNACYHLVQNLLFSSLLSQNIKIKLYRTIILPFVLYGLENW
jgi:hypothetical protein